MKFWSSPSRRKRGWGRGAPSPPFFSRVLLPLPRLRLLCRLSSAELYCLVRRSWIIRYPSFPGFGRFLIGQILCWLLQFFKSMSIHKRRLYSRLSHQHGDSTAQLCSPQDFLFFSWAMLQVTVTDASMLSNVQSRTLRLFSFRDEPNLRPSCMQCGPMFSRCGPALP